MGDYGEFCEDDPAGRIGAAIETRRAQDTRRTVAPQQSGERFCLAQDNDGHWYVIPVARQQEWDAQLELDEDDDAAWDPPTWANRTYGAPSLVSFVDPLISIV